MTESKTSLGIEKPETHLSGRVGAGTRAVTPATRRPGTRAAACWGTPPRGAGPPPHAWWATTPHRWWRGHPARGRGSTRWWTDTLSQYGRCCNFLPINLTSIHVFERLLGLFGSLKLHISVTPGQVRVESVHWQVNHFDFPISRKDLLNVFLGDIPCQPP